MDNLEKNKQLEKVVLESVEAVKKLGYTPLYAANYGSHNYNLDINSIDYQSDIDTKVIILPTLEELVWDSKPVSTTIEIGSGQCDIKDIRAFIPTLLKANIQFLEILCARVCWINPDYEEEFKWFIDNLDNLIKESKNELLRSIKGMCFEKQKAMCHPYPTIKWKIEKWGYDGKQLHHIMRLKDFINSYFYEDKVFRYALWYEDGSIEKDILIKAKLNNMSLEQALDYAEIYNEIVKRKADLLIDDYKIKECKYREEYQKRANQLIINNIKKKIEEDK